MTAFCWYESTPTVISTDTDTTYLNTPADRLPQDDVTQEWAALAKEEGTVVRVPMKRNPKGEAVALSVAEYAVELAVKAEAEPIEAEPLIDLEVKR